MRPPREGAARGSAGRDGPGSAPPRSLAIVGPTATGKTATAIEVARALGGEIVSVDSRQAYRGLEIGTAAPTARERAAVPHHGVGFLEPGERYGAGRFARMARSWIEDIERRGNVPILVGGTGFFLRALLDPVFREPSLDPVRRRHLERWMARRPRAELTAWARRLDPALAARAGELDPQRAMRALEIALLTGRPLSAWQADAPPEGEPLAAAIYALHLAPRAHRERIRSRAEKLLQRDWAEEVRRLERAGYGEDSAAFDAIGYREIAAWLRGEIGREDALERIERATWGYARRQRTWFRHQLPAGAVRLDAEPGAAAVAARIVADWRASGHTFGGCVGGERASTAGAGREPAAGGRGHAAGGAQSGDASDGEGIG